jgi:hypothetical protein
MTAIECTFCKCWGWLEKKTSRQNNDFQHHVRTKIARFRHAQDSDFLIAANMVILCMEWKH